MSDTTVLVPVKALHLAKSRVDVSPRRRQEIAWALVDHTLGTVASCVGPASLAVVTADPDVRALTEDLGGRVIPDPYRDLNRALEHALSMLMRSGVTQRVLVLVSDLPQVSAADLSLLLHEVSAADEPLHLADMAGTGTTAVSVLPGGRPRMHFGHRSADRFRAAGWRPLSKAPSGLRADLDTQLDLDRLGLPRRSHHDRDHAWRRWLSEPSVHECRSRGFDVEPTGRTSGRHR